MSCPMNDVRDFKNNRKATTNNVQQLHRSTPLHHARADEAEVEVTFEPVTCEEVTMTTTTTTTVEQPLNPVADAIKDALDTTNNETISEENTMADNNAQTQSVSITSVLERNKKLRRNRITTNIVSNVVTVAGVVAGAAANGRDVKRAAIGGSILAALSATCEIISNRKKADDYYMAEKLSEETYQEEVKVKPAEVATGLAASLGLGLVVGAFLCRKAVVAEE